MTDHFRADNTAGYTRAQLDELNRLLAAAVADLDPADPDYNETVQGRAERVLARFDPPGA